MRQRRTFVIFSPPGGWRIGVILEGAPQVMPVQPDSDEPAQLAIALAASLRSAGHSGEPVLLAVGSEMCLSAAVPTAGLPRRGRRQAAIYRLEERLPLAAEDFNADFLFHNGTALSVCARTADLQAIIEALAAQQVNIVAACPTAILSLNSIRHDPVARLHVETDVLLWQSGKQIEILCLAAATAVNWFSVPASPADIALTLSNQIIAHKRPIRIAAIDLIDDLTEEISGLPDVTVIGQTKLLMEHAALRSADRLARQEHEGSLDLLGGSKTWHVARQMRPALVATAAGVGILCVVFMLACWIRGTRYAALAARAEDRKVAAFRQLFPNEPTPVGIESRLRAVKLQRAGINGSGPRMPDALSSLHDLLANLPANSRYRITDLDIDNPRLSVQGEVSTHGDADAVATAIRHSPLFIIDDPQTLQLDGNAVHFSISGTVRSTDDQSPRRMP